MESADSSEDFLDGERRWTELILPTLSSTLICCTVLVSYVLNRGDLLLYRIRPYLKPNRVYPKWPSTLKEWISPIWKLDQDELLPVTNVDTYIMLRLLRIGLVYTSVMGSIGGLVLVPCYNYMGGLRHETEGITTFTMANVESGTGLLALPVLYVYIGTALLLWLFDQEWRVYLNIRFLHLSRGYDVHESCQPRYSLMLSKIPRKLRTKEALVAYFEAIFPGTVHSAHVIYDLAPLDELLKKRYEALSSLEHALNYKAEHGKELWINPESGLIASVPCQVKKAMEVAVPSIMRSSYSGGSVPGDVPDGESQGAPSTTLALRPPLKSPPGVVESTTVQQGGGSVRDMEMGSGGEEDGEGREMRGQDATGEEQEAEEEEEVVGAAPFLQRNGKKGGKDASSSSPSVPCGCVLARTFFEGRLRTANKLVKEWREEWDRAAAEKVKPNIAANITSNSDRGSGSMDLSEEEVDPSLLRIKVPHSLSLDVSSTRSATCNPLHRSRSGSYHNKNNASKGKENSSGADTGNGMSSSRGAALQAWQQQSKACDPPESNPRRPALFFTNVCDSPSASIWNVKSWLRVPPALIEQPVPEKHQKHHAHSGGAAVAGGVEKEGGGAGDGLCSREKQFAKSVREVRATGQGFVTFRYTLAKAAAAAAPLSLEDEMRTAPAPNPQEIYWGNITFPKQISDVRNHFTTYLIIVASLFYFLPVGAVQLVASLGSGFLADYLPVLASLGLVRAVPAVLERVHVHFVKGVSQETMERWMLSRHFNVLIGYIFANMALGIFFRSLDDLFVNIDPNQITAEPGDAFATVAQAIPAISTFFFNYIVSEALIAGSMEFSRIVDIFRVGVKVWFRDSSELTARYYKDHVYPIRLHRPKFGSRMPRHIVILLICFIYGPIAPVVSLAGVAFFTITLIVFRHKSVFMFVSTFETGGEFFIWAHRCVMVSYLFSLGPLLLLLLLKASWLPVLCLLPIFPIVVDKWKQSWRKYGVKSLGLPLDTARKIDEEARQGDTSVWSCSRFESDMYLQPALRAPLTLEPSSQLAWVSPSVHLPFSLNADTVGGRRARSTCERLRHLLGLRRSEPGRRRTSLTASEVGENGVDAEMGGVGQSEDVDGTRYLRHRPLGERPTFDDTTNRVTHTQDFRGGALQRQRNFKNKDEDNSSVLLRNFMIKGEDNSIIMKEQAKEEKPEEGQGQGQGQQEGTPSDPLTDGVQALGRESHMAELRGLYSWDVTSPAPPNMPPHL